MLKRFLLYILLFFSCYLSIAQEEVRDGNFLAVGINYGLDFPIGQLSKRFGTSFHAGLSLDLFKSKMNGAYGIEGLFIFGENVNEDVISNLRLDNTAILGIDGQYADVFLRERGAYLGIYISKIIVPLKTNQRSGLAADFGIGILQHNVRIQVDTRNAPNLEGEYLKGYDRNSIGPALKQSLSYTHIGKNKNLNYSLSLSIMEGFTSNTRPINFDTKIKDEGTHLDLLISLDLKWYLPLKNMNGVEEEIFY